MYASTRAVVLDRVRQQVEQHLRKPLPVRMDAVVRERFSAVLQVTVALCGEWANQAQHFVQQSANIDGFEGKLLTVGFDAGEIEHLVDEGEEVLAGFQDVIHPFALIRRQFLPGKKLGKTEHAVHGRPQLMAHATQELTLGPVGRFRTLAGALCFPARTTQRGAHRKLPPAGLVVVH